MTAARPGRRAKRDLVKRAGESASGHKPRDLPGAVLPPTSMLLLTMVCLATILAMLAVYSQTSGFGFISYDDPRYVSENPTVQQGLTAHGFAWAFTTSYFGNWHPLTWLSYMMDWQLFGLNPGAQHLVNLAFHLSSSLLLFIALVRMTRQPWRSVLAAAIFALHPLHVESVVWIAERKDTLSAFFGFLTLILYIRYTEASTARRYISMASAFALSLMAKPMMVTFPFVLLLLDLWPLRRLEWPPAWRSLQHLLWEKVPMFAMVAGSSVLTFLAQRSSGFMLSFAHRPFYDRLANAAIAYVSYIGKAFWPTNLGVFYPFQEPVAEKFLVALVVLIAVTVASLLLVKRRPYLLVGWLWYLGMLVPVIGIVQVGAQSKADRYTYLPLVGFSLAVVWGSADLLEERRLPRRAGVILAGLVLLLLAMRAHRQTGYWKDSETLYEHTLAVTTRNYLVHNYLGVVLANEGRYNDAMTQQRKALAIAPDFAEAHSDLSGTLLRLGRLDEAAIEATEALRLKPNYADAQINLCGILGQMGRFAEAIGQCTEAERSKPESPAVQHNLCGVLYQLGRLDEAVAHCTEALRIQPDFAEAHKTLGVVLTKQGKADQAIHELEEALRISPGDLQARQALEQLASRTKSLPTGGGQ